MPKSKGIQWEISISIEKQLETGLQLVFRDTSRYMYTLDCLYLNKDALNLKKKLLRTTEKVFSLYVCNVSLLHRNPGLPLTTEENEAKTHLK